MKAKNLVCTLFCLAIAVPAAGCASSEETSGASGGSSGETVAASEGAASSSDGPVDIDLASLSKTMAYSEVCNITSNPDKYAGKTVRMRGLFSAFKDDRTGKRYFSCVVTDGTGCCWDEIEFTLAGDRSYPADYPDEDDPITVEGVLDTYVEDHETYCTLKDAVLA